MSTDWIAFLGVATLASLSILIAITPHLLGRYGKEALLCVGAWASVNAVLRLLLILGVVTNTGGRQMAGLSAAVFAVILIQIIVASISERASE